MAHPRRSRREGRAALVTAAVALTLGMLGAAPPARAASVRVQRDVVYARHGDRALHLDLFRPSTSRRRHPAIVMFHSGGFCCGDKSELASEGRRFAALGYVAASVEYRLAPPARFPATISDSLESVRWVRRHARGLQVDPARIGAFGDSAGGNLAALTATIGHGRWTSGSRVRVAVSYSGPMDLPALAATTSSPDSDTPAYYLGCAPSQCRGRFAYASPIHHVDSTDPPMLLVNSDREEMPLSQATRMAGRLHWRHVPHRIILLRGSRHALQYERDVWSRTVAFLGRSLRP